MPSNGRLRLLALTEQEATGAKRVLQKRGWRLSGEGWRDKAVENTSLQYLEHAFMQHHCLLFLRG